MTHRTDSQKRRQHKSAKARATWGSATSRQEAIEALNRGEAA